MPPASAEDIKRWFNDPALFAREAFGLELADYQEAILRDLAAHDHVAASSGHKVGKSTTDCIAGYWWYCTRERAGVVLTAPTSRQVKRILWKELGALARRARKVGRVNLPQVPRDPGTGVQGPDGRYIVGFSTDNQESMAGFSGPAMFFIIDEASGVDESLFEAIEGNMAGGEADDPTATAKLLMTSNPTQTSGKFFDAFHRERHLWKRHQISSEQSPNVRAGKVVVPGMATRTYVEDRKRRFGVDSDRYRVRVLGKFPRKGAHNVVSVDAIEAARKRWEKAQAKLVPGFASPTRERLHVGVDVARFGDDESAIAPVRGDYTFPLRVVHGLDTVDVAGKVIEVVRELRQPGDEKPLVKVDVIGIGAGVVDTLRRSPEVEVVEVNVSEAADAPAEDEPEYPNLRSQLWFELADWIQTTGTLPPDEELETELAAPLYGYDEKQRRVVEKKQKIKERIKRSPDRAEALMLAKYDPDIDFTVHRVPGRSAA